MDSLLEIRKIEKIFDEKLVLTDVSLQVRKGEILALLGPSGCGKTTLLRLVAGLERPTKGELSFEGGDLQKIPVHQRCFGMVFQEYALFPHKDVAGNVEFGLRMLRWSNEEVQRRVKEVLELVGMRGFETRQVFELSGGEQQRVALARSLAPRPKLLLLDEPLGSLDRALRERLMVDLRQILKQADGGDGQYRDSGETHRDARESTSGSGVTSIYVTHDQEEAFALADRVAVMSDGVIEQIGTPLELYRHPNSPVVARFLGMENILPCRTRATDPTVAETEIGVFHLAAPSEVGDNQHQLLIRPEAASIAKSTEKQGNYLEAALVSISFRGRLQFVTVQVSNAGRSQKLKLTFDTSIKLPPPGSRIGIVLDPSQLLLLE